jgi:hypothetical protein
MLQFASRLHTDRMYNAAVTLASKRNKPAAAERIAQLLIVRDGGALPRPATSAHAAAPGPAAAGPPPPPPAARTGFGLASKAAPAPVASMAAPSAAAEHAGAAQPRPGRVPAPPLQRPAISDASASSALELGSSTGTTRSSAAPASAYGRQLPGANMNSDDDDDDSAGGAANPFVKSIYQSPKRKRGAFDGLAVSSPAQAAGLNRQASIAVAARDKRLKELQS